jgi:hypothetical protein
MRVRCWEGMNSVRSSGDEQHIWFKSGDLDQRNIFKSEDLYMRVRCREGMNFVRSSGDEQHIGFKSGDLNQRNVFKSEDLNMRDRCREGMNFGRSSGDEHIRGTSLETCTSMLFEWKKIIELNSDTKPALCNGRGHSWQGLEGIAFTGKVLKDHG